MAEFQRPTFPYVISPIVICDAYPWITKSDTKYKDEFHFEGIADPSEPGVQEWIDQRVAEAEACFNAYIEAEINAKRLNKGTAKQWSVYVPIADELDGEGEPTGRKVISFKQSHHLKLKDGTEKTVEIGVWDANDKPIPKEDIPAIYGGSKLRVKTKSRFITVQTSKQVGIRLDFPMVQIIELAQGNGGGGASGFGAVEGGFTPSHGSTTTGNQGADNDEVDDDIPY